MDWPVFFIICALIAVPCFMLYTIWSEARAWDRAINASEYEGSDRHMSMEYLK